MSDLIVNYLWYHKTKYVKSLSYNKKNALLLTKHCIICYKHLENARNLSFSTCGIISAKWAIDFHSKVRSPLTAKFCIFYLIVRRKAKDLYWQQSCFAKSKAWVQ